MIVILLLLSLLGFADASYLTYEHLSGTIPPCTANSIFGDCGKVLSSSYSEVYRIPLALFGAIHYALESVLFATLLKKSKTVIKKLAIILTTAGFLFSLYFVYLQLFVIKAICPYCMASAGISILLFILTLKLFPNSRKQLFASLFAWIYQYLVKPIFFQIDPEIIHEHLTKSGQTMGRLSPIRNLAGFLFNSHHATLSQTVFGHYFRSPIGLGAGFDYEARLPQILPHLGFGFQTIGTITNSPHAGNPKPRLGRLPKSKSLMVNKGFKNPGIHAILERLSSKAFAYPVGLSIGTQKNSVDDICQAFKQAEKANIAHTYYELNISCPNIQGAMSFYPTSRLNTLLTQIDRLKLKKPVLIKMPIDQTDSHTKSMLNTISKHKIEGVIFGNLQKNRSHPALNPQEVAKFTVGNFSGQPCFDRSNELISLCYKSFKKRFIIIGCGGVFTAKDAYEKIIRGATLVQLVTGLIYQGPQVASQINAGLESILVKAGHPNLSSAIGSKQL